MSVSGSSATGNCSSVSNTRAKSTCTDPTSSVLFDGVIPTLTGLDGDMWASQLLTLQKKTIARPSVTFDFTGTQDYVGLSGRLEVVMFNCPERGISASAIRVPTSSSTSVTNFMVVNINITSCGSLVRVCTPIMTVQPSISLQFPYSDMVYLAEVTFYAASSASTCPPDTIITMVDSQCASFSTSIMPIILTSVITVIITALLATVIFVLALIAVCKCHPKFTPGGAETGTSAGGEGQVYEQVDGCEGGVAVSDPTYMEVGAGGAGGGGGGGGGGVNTFQLKENEAYAVTK